jgi:hypothetical protein
VLGNRFDIGGLQQFLETLTFDELTETFAVFAFFHPPVPDRFDDFLDFVVGFFRFDERNQQGAHLGTVEDGGFGADQNGQTAVVADPQGTRHDVDAVHAAGTFLVVDLQFAVFHPHAFGGAEIDDFLLDVERDPSRGRSGRRHWAEIRR